MGHQGFTGRNKAQKRYRDKSKDNGTCKDCSNKSVDGKQQCQHHLDVNKKFYQKNRDSHTVNNANNMIDCKKHGLTLKEDGECHKCRIGNLTSNVQEASP